MKNLDYFLLFKLLLSIFVVVTLSEISKRISPFLGGILSGLPLGTGLSVYFISYEQGVDFLLQGVPWGIAGLSASIIFCFIYLITSRRFQAQTRIFSILFSSIASISSFLITGFFLSLIPMTLTMAIIIFVSIFVLNLIAMTRLVAGGQKEIKIKSSSIKIFIRGLIVGIIILFITGAAAISGSKWSGILSSFPSTLYSLLVILNYDGGKRILLPVIKGFSFSISTLVVFYLAFLFFSPIYGLNYGFLITYGICAVYLYLLARLRRIITFEAK